MPEGMAQHDAVERLQELHSSGGPVSLEDVQNALRDSNEWWSAVFDLAGLALVIGSPDGEVVAISPSFENVFGYSHSELRHAGGVVAMTHPEDLQADLELFGELVAGRRDHYQLEKRYFRKDGSLMWGRLTVLLLRDAQGQPAFVVAMTQDISETKQSQALEEPTARRLSPQATGAEAERQHRARLGGSEDGAGRRARSQGEGDADGDAGEGSIDHQRPAERPGSRGAGIGRPLGGRGRGLLFLIALPTPSTRLVGGRRPR